MKRSELVVRAADELKKRGKRKLADGVRVILGQGKPYKSLNDAAAVTGNDAYKPGQTEIWYLKPQLTRDHRWAIDMLKKQGIEPPSAKTLKKTHVLIGKIAEKSPGRIFQFMQGEFWAPQGEGNALVKKAGAGHTSMSVGDIIKIGNKIHRVEPRGFHVLARVVKADEAKKVAEIILKQLGGAGRLKAMLGAKDFLYDRNPPSLQFKFPNKAKGKPNFIKISYDTGKDLYNIEFGRIKGMTYKKLKTFSGIQVDQLRSLFEKTTSLRLSL